jgi:two-component system, sensor histidine kinase and response regulator
VGVASVVGQGSCFWFTLPLEPASHAEQRVDLTRLGKRVLVVDDNATTRRVLTAQLHHAGYEVTSAETGAAALACLRQAVGECQPFEAVLVDLELPDMDAATLGQHIMRSPQLSQARIVVLTPLDRRGETARFAELGFAAHLHKPVRARELLAGLDRVLAKEAREWHLQSQPIVTRSSLTTAARRCRGNVLLVEDNAVNQKVAVRFLERMGCTVRVADNGAEGVKAYREGRFDIVLMDLQMPVMDGLTATRAIRTLEGEGRATPIVALTANAMTGQIDRCLQAGMNGFLSKPLEISRLQEVLERHGLSAALDGSDDAAPAATAGPVDANRWHELTAGDGEFAGELADAFIASGQQLMEEIGTAIAAFDRGVLTRAAHKLKGASANIHADALRDLAHELETQSPALDQARLKELVQKLRSEFERTANFLEQQVPEPRLQVGARGL